MTENESPVAFLDMDRAWDLLAADRLGRLGVQDEVGVDIYPVNYAVDGESIVFRTADGSKLSNLKAHSLVTFEIDHWGETAGYSVVARGHAAPITDPDEIAQVEALRLKPWVPTVKTTFVRIFVHSITARKFFFGQDPIEKYR
ncbi:MAG: pyridoxamine 5'-phosphate oxidase family protein [Propionibacteriaceae bacterium]|nr:pyridoxamine 5'-phosphate oxidase family protein [Propionibacteriaceae bacterium]